MRWVHSKCSPIRLPDSKYAAPQQQPADYTGSALAEQGLMQREVCLRV
jgi:hypothetical protein